MSELHPHLPYEGLRILEVVPPQGPDLVAAPNIPHSEARSPMGDCLNVEAWRDQFCQVSLKEANGPQSGLLQEQKVAWSCLGIRMVMWGLDFMS